jgi:hypothetical protein
MKDVDDLDALSESTLRRAMRLEADERAPRLDATAIASAAERRTVAEQVLRVVRGVALVGVSLGLEAGIAVAAFTWLADLDPSGLYAFALATFAGAAERLVPFTGLVTDPSVATATLAALVFATLYERGRRDGVYVQAT